MLAAYTEWQIKTQKLSDILVEVYCIPVSKEKLRSLPTDERVLILLMGYVSNQLLMIQKLLIYSTKLQPTQEVQLHATGVQTQMLIRIAVSAVFEAWRLIESRFLSNQIGRDYISWLDSDGLQALDGLKLQFGKSALLSIVRNNFGFHFPKTVDAEAAFQAAADDEGFDKMWKVYFSQHGFNSLFLLSDAVFLHGIAQQMGTKDLEELQKRLLNELRDASTNAVHFAQAFFAAAWIKNFGEVIYASEIIVIDDAPDLHDTGLPFFVEVE